MTTRTVTAMFNSRPNAERAAEQLQSQLNLTRGSVRLSPEIGTTDTGYDQSAPYQETGFFASLKSMFLPDEDRYAYAEGMRRGNVLVSAQVDESEINRAADLLEHAGAVDLDQEETSWRKSGWTGYDATRHAATPAATATTLASGASATTAGATTAGTAARGATAAGMTATARDSVAGATAGTATGRDEFIPVVEERLVVGKREVDRGRVRVRSYVVERPVEAEVRLHEERVEVERRPVDRALSEADRAAAFQERVIEAAATSEEAVIGKEARVVEEIAVHKEASERTETVHDTVRRTEVEVEDTAANQRAAGTAAGTAARGTGVAGAVDRTLGTNMSGTNPAAHAPDGTPGNPPGTMASRAVDKTLGTNISGANPSNKT